MITMSEAFRRNFMSIGFFILFIIAPILVSGYLLGDPFLSAIIDNGLWYLVFAFIAGFFDAIKDTLSDHFSISVFRKLNPLFWDKIPSAKGKKILGMRFNGWHIAKMLHTAFLGLSAVFFISINREVFNDVHTIDYILWYGFYKWGFNINYSWLLKAEL